VPIDAGKALNIHRGTFRQPAGLSNIHFSTQSPQLGSER
jgi:hypothetical protein